MESSATGPRGPRVAIVGAGAGGLSTGVLLKKAGFEDFVILEKNAGVGGTWYRNRYPGLTCDIPAPLYHTNGSALARMSLFDDQLIVLMERFDAAQAVDLVERHRIETVTMVPTMLLRVARLPDLDRRDLSSLQAVLQGGAVLLSGASVKLKAGAGVITMTPTSVKLEGPVELGAASELVIDGDAVELTP